jgi:hypothetical protein
MDAVAFEISKMKDEYMKTGYNLKKVFQDIVATKDSKAHQFERLKSNIKIKKDILAILY